MIAVLVVLSGCAADLPVGDSQSNGECPKELPDMPDELSNESAKRFAERYQQTLTYNRLCSKEDFGLGETVATSVISVEFTTEEAYYIFAQQAYHYSNANVDADGADSSVFRVSDDSFSRVDHQGADQYDVATYSGPPTADTADHDLRFRVFNFANETRSVSVELVYRNDSELALQDRLELDANQGVKILDVANRSGEYSLHVTSGENQSQHTIELNRTDRNIVAIYISPDSEAIVGPVRDYY